jgi:hypothetical protein
MCLTTYKQRSPGAEEGGIKGWRRCNQRALHGVDALATATLGRPLEALEVCRRLSPSAPTLSAEDATLRTAPGGPCSLPASFGTQQGLVDRQGGCP